MTFGSLNWVEFAVSTGFPEKGVKVSNEVSIAYVGGLKYIRMGPLEVN